MVPVFLSSFPSVWCGHTYAGSQGKGSGAEKPNEKGKTTTEMINSFSRCMGFVI